MSRMARSRKPLRSPRSSVAIMARRSSGRMASFCSGGRPWVRRIPGEHGGDVPVLAVDRLAALGEIPHERREPPLDGADRARLRAGRAGGAGGDVEAENLRIRGQGREVLPPRPGGNSGASRRRRRGWCFAMWRRGRSRGRSRRAARGARAGEAAGSTAGGGANDGSSGRSEGFWGSFSSVCGLELGMIHYKEHDVR